MIKFERFQDYFTLNDVPYSRGRYRIRVIGQQIGIAEIGCHEWIANLTRFDQWVDGGLTPFPDLATLRSELRLGIFLPTI